MTPPKSVVLFLQPKYFKELQKDVNIVRLFMQMQPTSALTANNPVQPLRRGWVVGGGVQGEGKVQLSLRNGTWSLVPDSHVHNK